jgi:hypothetical protein
MLLSGRCLAYGEGITYWPLTELGPVRSEVDFQANRDEIALQTRLLFERLAREQPLVVVFDDLQWAEPTFLDLVDHVTDLARDAPILLICSARPELLDARPGWGGGKLNATTMLLEALTEGESAQLVDNLLLAGADPATKKRIATAAEGNPLFVEEMLAMVAEDGDVAVPPTIQALLAARLDRLSPDERTLLECAAVEGQEFHREALAALVPTPFAERLTHTVQSLVRKDLIRPTGEQAFRFKQLLLRDAAYEAIPKEQRAELHERFAERVEEAFPELDEIRGYHLEQAYRNRAELGPIDERGHALARRASRLLAAAGKRAFERADIPATINLLERAVRLLPEGDGESVALYPDLAAAMAEGGDLRRPAELYRAAEELGDQATALRARVGRLGLELMRGARMADYTAPFETAVTDAARLGEEAILAEALRRQGVLTMWLGDNEKAEHLLRRAIEHAEAVGEPRLRSEGVHDLAILLLWGSAPVEVALPECRRLAQSIGIDHTARTELAVVQGVLLALSGDFEQGRRLAADGRQALLERGQRVHYAAISQPVAVIELLAGDASAAEDLLREAHDILSAAGERGYLSTVSALLALALAKQERYLEADEFAEQARQVGAEDDLTTNIYWRVAKAQVEAHGDELAEAARLAAEAIGLARSESFDLPIVTVEVAAFLEPGRARAALEQALASATAKGNVVSAAQARAQLEAL